MRYAPIVRGDGFPIGACRLLSDCREKSPTKCQMHSTFGGGIAFTTRNGDSPSYRSADNRNSSTERNRDCNSTVGNRVGSTAKRNRVGNSRSSLGAADRSYRLLEMARSVQLARPTKWSRA
jgi:hypothetical protein